MSEPDLKAYDFHLPDESIALRPAEPRDACRLLCVQGEEISDHGFRDIIELLKPGDLLIGNDTKVIPALLFGVRPSRDEAGRDVDVQVNLLERQNSAQWDCLCKPGRRLKPLDVIRFPHGLKAIVGRKLENGRIRLEFNLSGEPFWQALDKIGRMPIPPYIAKQRPSDDADHSDYQTVFANEAGSVAAPTAGLHFTDDLFRDLNEKGVDFRTVTLHVGAGTFAGLTEQNLTSGKLHSEVYDVSVETLEAIRSCKRRGGRVIAIGTTALRTLETISDDIGSDTALSGDTDIFIRPGYQFKCIDGLITNFHLPRSSLFMLVCALMGTDLMQTAYRHAVEDGYRFYSYGDACLLIPDHD